MNNYALMFFNENGKEYAYERRFTFWRIWSTPMAPF